MRWEEWAEIKLHCVNNEVNVEQRVCVFVSVWMTGQIANASCVCSITQCH